MEEAYVVLVRRRLKGIRPRLWELEGLCWSDTGDSILLANDILEALEVLQLGAEASHCHRAGRVWAIFSVTDFH